LSWRKSWGELFKDSLSFVWVNEIVVSLPKDTWTRTWFGTAKRGRKKRRAVCKPAVNDGCIQLLFC
jgi:hypothetical protein